MRSVKGHLQPRLLLLSEPELRFLTELLIGLNVDNKYFLGMDMTWLAVWRPFPVEM